MPVCNRRSPSTTTLNSPDFEFVSWKRTTTTLLEFCKCGWLKRIARYPHDNDTWLGGPHTIIANGEPPEPLAPNTKLSCLMLLANPSEFGRWTRPDDGAEVVFYDLFGLYTQERNLELREGLGELLDRFQSRFISNVLDPQRPNVAVD